MAPYTYTPLAPCNVTHHGRHEYRPGLREGVSYMFEHLNAQMRVPANYEDEVAAEAGIEGNMIHLHGLKKFTSPLIRLVILESGSRTDPLCCRLEQCDLREEPQFEALSYFWGPPIDMREITCSERKVLVSPNLEVALRALRYPDIERVLWVDALCINQIDKAELDAQVNMMGYIYSCAERVLVWLGVGHEKDSAAIETIQETVKLINELTYTNEDDMESAAQALFNNPRLPANAWQHIGNLFARPYFQRLWVIQEVVNSTSTEVLYGDRTIKWDDITKFALLSGNGLLSFCLPETRRSFHLSSLEESNVNIINDLLRSRKNNEEGRPFFDILFHTHKFQATNVRDKVFSILNLPRFKGEWIPIPKYELSPFEVFRDFTIVDLTRNNSVKILSWVNTAGVERSSNDTSPSWIPSIDDFRGPAPSFFMASGRKPFNYSTKVDARINGDNTLLKIKGRLLSESIEHVSEARSSCYAESNAQLPLQAADFTNSILEIERRWFASCFGVFLKAKIIPPRLEEINTENAEEDPPSRGVNLYLHEIVSWDTYKRFLLTMCRNWNPYTRARPVPVLLENTRLVTFALLSNGSEYYLEDLFGDGKDVFLEIYKEIICQEPTKWKKIAALADGRIGWVPNNAQEGDRVCVFSGGRESFLLREIGKEDGASGHYKLLGECYFEGLEAGAVGLEDRGDCFVGLEADVVGLEGREDCAEVELSIL